MSNNFHNLLYLLYLHLPHTYEEDAALLPFGCWLLQSKEQSLPSVCNIFIGTISLEIVLFRKKGLYAHCPVG